MTAIETVPAAAAEFGKPRMRGWLHVYAFFVSIVASAVLCTVAATATSRTGVGAIDSCVIYSLTICALFGTSALYHRLDWSPRGELVMRRLDHSMIFIFIAGTYTPFCVLLLSPTTATVILSIVWGGAAMGVASKMFLPHASRWLSTPLYLLLGWVAVAVLPDILHAGGLAALVFLLVGGLFYTLGAVLYACQKPNPWPRTFGHHEFFHACTLLAAISHQAAIYFALFH